MNLNTLFTRCISYGLFGPPKHFKFPGIDMPDVLEGSACSSFGMQEDHGRDSVNAVGSGDKICLAIVEAEHVKSECDDFYQTNWKKMGVCKSSCLNFWQHKIVFLSAAFLDGHNIPWTLAVQKKGQTMILFNKTLHRGINLVMNVAEAVNFPTRKDWWEEALFTKKVNFL